MKRSNSLYNKHFLCLAALFVLGNGVITAPFLSANRFSFLSFLLSFALAILVAFLAFFIPVNKLTTIPFILLSLYCVGDTGITFIKFIKANLLPKTAPFLIALPFILILGYMAFQRLSAVLKLCFVSFFVVLGVILLFFFATLKDFNIKNIFIYELPSVRLVLEQMYPFIKTVVLPILLLPVLAGDLAVKKGANVLGVAVGCALFGVCILNSVLLFGIDFAAALPYPYSAAGSTVTFGNLFTRMDGLLYFVYLVSCVTKCIVGIEVIKKSRSVFAP